MLIKAHLTGVQFLELVARKTFCFQALLVYKQHTHGWFYDWPTLHVC